MGFLTSRRSCFQNAQCNHFSTIPYIQDTLQIARRILNEAGVKASLKTTRSHHKPNSIIPEGPTKPLRKKLLYLVPCSNCNFVYIGQTKVMFG